MQSIKEILIQKFLSVATPLQVESFIESVFESISSKSEIRELYEIICGCEMSHKNIEAILEVSEWEYLHGNMESLCKYIYLLYKKTNTKSLQKYYFDLLYKNNEITAEELESFLLENGKTTECIIDSKRVNKYNNETILYNYSGIEKEYGIYSFSDKIGLNMTLLKTPYGAIIFDCGAKIESYGTAMISLEDIKCFLKAFNLTVEDVVAVVISHAHLDHYGSINSLVKVGIEKSKIYIEDITKMLISEASREDYLINDYSSIDSFHYPNKKMEIIPFRNGHILGSNGYIVHFDNQNVVFTGDFCIHNQPIVNGLNIEDIISEPYIKEYGVSCLITETTYGNKNTILSSEEATEVFKHFVDLIIANDYKVFIPSFAIGRSQEIAYLLRGNKILIDGLAVAITHTYQRCVENIRIFDNNTHFATAEIEDKIRNFDLHDVIVASSGMISENSTSYNYISEFLKSKDNVCIIKSGFISSESMGDMLLKEWKGDNNIVLDIPLSAHASKDEIVELINKLDPDKVVLIHGDGLDVSYSDVE